MLWGLKGRPTGSAPQRRTTLPPRAPIRPLGILAGGGRLPLILAESAAARGDRLTALYAVAGAGPVRAPNAPSTGNRALVGLALEDSGIQWRMQWRMPVRLRTHGDLNHAPQRLLQLP